MACSLGEYEDGSHDLDAESCINARITRNPLPHNNVEWKGINSDIWRFNEVPGVKKDTFDLVERTVTPDHVHIDAMCWYLPLVSTFTKSDVLRWSTSHELGGSKNMMTRARHMPIAYLNTVWMNKNVWYSSISTRHHYIRLLTTDEAEYCHVLQDPGLFRQSKIFSLTSILLKPELVQYWVNTTVLTLLSSMHGIFSYWAVAKYHLAHFLYCS